MMKTTPHSLVSLSGKSKFRTLMLLATLAGPALGMSACVEESPALTPTEREALREFILTTAPTPQHPLEIQFENKVQLMGYDIDVETITPGQPFTITWYWHVERRLGGGWLQFTHLADAAGTDRLNQDAAGTIRERYPASRWMPNEYIRDVQTITLPADWNSDRVVIYHGFWHEDHRLQVASGPSDGTNRGRAASIPVSAPAAGATPTTIVAPPAAQLPSLNVRRATAAVQIDGQLNEADWAAAPASSAFVNTMNGSRGEVRANVKMLWDDQAVYFGFDVADDYLHATGSERDAHLWEQDCVEIMADPDGDGTNYFELQVAPTGQVFDTHYDTRRQPQPFGHVDWNSQIETRVSTRGTPNDDAADEGYTVEIRIPYASFRHGDGPLLVAPAVDSNWRFNFYVMDTRPDGGQRTAGWSPTLEGDFHVPARFGRAVMTGEAPAPTAALVLPPGMQRAAAAQVAAAH
jgi:hypothetical protein